MSARHYRTGPIRVAKHITQPAPQPRIDWERIAKGAVVLLSVVCLVWLMAWTVAESLVIV